MKRLTKIGLSVGIFATVLSAGLDFLERSGIAEVPANFGLFLVGPVLWLEGILASRAAAYACIFIYYALIAMGIAQLPRGRYRFITIVIVAVVHLLSVAYYNTTLQRAFTIG